MTLAQAERGTGAAGGVLDTISLSGGRTLIVRTVREADVEGLDALFEGLSDDDRYYRFFGFSHPGRKFLEQLTRAGQEGGYRLVAVVSGRVDRLVAEAGYAILPDGNGEFALTVATGWRGWLGPYLLDAVVAAAAARGVPNLQADILVSNARMLALVAERGYLTLTRRGSEVRVAIDAAAPRRAACALLGNGMLTGFGTFTVIVSAIALVTIMSANANGVMVTGTGSRGEVRAGRANAAARRS